MHRLGLSVAVFLVLGTTSAFYLFSSLGETVLYNAWGYTIYADFESATGLGPGTPVEVAGVRVGRVDTVQLTGTRARVRLTIDSDVDTVQLTGTRARVRLTIDSDIEIQEDAIASIHTKGLLGGPYVLISLGGSDRLIPPGGVLRETESPIDLPGLMKAYVDSRKAPGEGASAP